MEFEIDDDVPLPTRHGRASAYPYDKLEVGQSFWVPTRRGLNTTAWTNRIGWRFVTRKEIKDGVVGTRVFRTE